MHNYFGEQIAARILLKEFMAKPRFQSKGEHKHNYSNISKQMVLRHV